MVIYNRSEMVVCCGIFSERVWRGVKIFGAEREGPWIFYELQDLLCSLSAIVHEPL